MQNLIQAHNVMSQMQIAAWLWRLLERSEGKILHNAKITLKHKKKIKLN